MKLTRYSMYKSIEHSLPSPISGDILAVSGIEDFRECIPFKNPNITEANYPAYDMQSLPFQNDTFDCLISDQIIEHLEDPFKAVRESRRVVKPGGLIIISSCFLNPLHPSPNDYWRFSVAGMRSLAKRSGLKVICACGWGNRLVLTLISWSSRFRRMDIPDYPSLKRRLATWNQEEFHIVTWLVARK